MDKSEILILVKTKVEEKILYLVNLIEDTRSSNNETKSSMGDKYETGREMLQQEINRLKSQLDVYLQQQEILKKLNGEASSKVESGALVETNKGIFFVSVSLGEFHYQGKKVFAISEESPLAIAMMNKQVGNVFSLNQIPQTILSIM